jgi:hypothetical protein
MKRTTRVLSTILAALLITGVSWLYSLADDPCTSWNDTSRYDNCPMYPVSPRIFLSNTDAGYREAAQLTEQVTAKLTAQPTLDAAIPSNNYIDDYIFGKMASDSVPNASLCTDEEFIRRVYLDLTGRIPATRDVRNFLQNSDPNKRAGLIDQLLSSNEFVDRMTMWFGDLLRNTSTAVSLSGRNAYYQYIKDFVQNNRPYNQVVQELITASGDNYGSGPANFFAREWIGGPAQDTQDNLAITTAKVFLGMPIECISCHSGAHHLEGINLWLVDRYRKDLWGMSAFFSGVRVQRQMLDQNQYQFQVTEIPSTGYDTRVRGGLRPQRTLDPGDPPVIPTSYILTGMPAAPGKNPRQELARMIISDMQFARATVNYLWELFLGVGIVDPPDSFDYSRQEPWVPMPDPWDIQPTHPELLEQLAQEFRASNFDLRHMIGLILKSNAYQLSARFDGTWEDRYARYFARHFIRRMSAEQLHDAIATATGLPGSYTIQGFSSPVQWAMQLPDTTEPRSNGAVAAFLNTFQRGDRDINERPAMASGSILQSLNLMNNTFVTQRVRASTSGSLIQRLRSQSLPNDMMVEEIFLATLSRMPTADERSAALNMIMSNPSNGPEDLQWVLINKLDFIFY